MSAPPSTPFRRGLLSGAAAGTLLLIAAVPSRAPGMLKGWEPLAVKVARLLASAVLDVSALSLGMGPLLLLATVLVPALVRPLRRAAWQRLGAPLLTLPLCFALWVLTIIAQEVKSERGAYPTLLDLAEGGGNASFIGGTLDFVRYQRIWLPTLVGVGVATCLLAWAIARSARSTTALLPWRGWVKGLCVSLLGWAVLVPGLAIGQAQLDNRFSAASMGDPLTSLVESTVDLALRRGPSTPRDLVLSAGLPSSLAAPGAARLGWPPLRTAKDTPCWPHPHARPLDFEQEPASVDPHGRDLLRALAAVSAQLFAGGDGKVAVFQLSLESFRADDVKALNPLAAEQIAPFTNGLYASARTSGARGVLASGAMYQAGVRTAQGLGAALCGVGTLPYNLSFIRDLQPFPMRCACDVLGEAGFAGNFFYGSDPSFDEMELFFKGHHLTHVVSQEQLPEGLPKGAWGGVTDFGVFDAAVQQVAEAMAAPDAGPQFSLVMSLSNHSPFTQPEDLPEEVVERVGQALASTTHRADADDRKRLNCHSYTDAAVQRFFERLDASGLSSRALVLLAADHSTGEAYVWGPQPDADSEEAKAQIPFAIVVPKAFLARAKDRPALEAALARAQVLLDATPLSQNDLPTLLLALLSKHPGLAALPASARWHSMGGQVTSPHFAPGGEPTSFVLGINGVSELFVLDRQARRVGGYEDSVFLKTRADRYRVTPRLIPAAATLAQTLEAQPRCP